MPLLMEVWYWWFGLVWFGLVYLFSGIRTSYGLFNAEILCKKFAESFGFKLSIII